MKSVTGIIPEEFMDPGKIGDVMAYLKAAPLPAVDKVKLLTVWAHNVGAKVSSSQRATVRATGTDEA